MSKAPRKIWYDTNFLTVGLIPIDDSDTPYIRADIVDELVEALEDLLRQAEYADEDTVWKLERAASALAKAKGESDD